MAIRAHTEKYFISENEYFSCNLKVWCCYPGEPALVLENVRNKFRVNLDSNYLVSNLSSLN